jgi:hypothetical protein
METYLPCLGVSSVEEVAMLELDIGRQKTFPNLRLISHRRNQSWGCTTLNFGRGNCNQYPEKSSDQGDEQYRERKTDSKITLEHTLPFSLAGFPAFMCPGNGRGLTPKWRTLGDRCWPSGGGIRVLAWDSFSPANGKGTWQISLSLAVGILGGFVVKTSRKLRHDVSYNKNKNK